MILIIVVRKYHKVKKDFFGLIKYCLTTVIPKFGRNRLRSFQTKNFWCTAGIRFHVLRIESQSPSSSKAANTAL